MPPVSRLGRFLFFFFIGPACGAEFDQQATLTGSGSESQPPPPCTCPVYPVSQGSSVALSADGNTAVINGFGDYNGVGGAAWIFTRSEGVWSQQGGKLIGTGSVGNALGTIQSVAISPDGNTALLGRAGDNSLTGALWVFTRSDGVWSQQGDKLVGSGSIGPFQTQAGAVAISADGTTAVIDGRGDNHDTGAGWVFVRSNGVWNQQGDKLVGYGVVGPGPPFQCCPAISGDGNTILFAAVQPGGGNGFSWVFTRNNGVWSQQGGPLIGTDVGGSIYQSGTSALSADGNTAIVSGYDRVTLAAFAWIFRRSGGIWTQQGSRLEASEPLRDPTTQVYVSLSADAGTALVNNTIFTCGRDGIWQKTGLIPAPVGPAAFSAGGSTVIIGEPRDNNGLGEALIFTDVATGRLRGRPPR